MLRFTDIMQGRHSALEPRFSHFVMTLMVFVAACYVANEFGYRLPWYVALLLVLATVISSVGLVISFSSLRHSKMIVVQGLVFAYVAAQFGHDWVMSLAYGAGAFIAVYFVVKTLCGRFLKLRNVWETATGIVAFCMLYPYTVMIVKRLIY